MPFGEKFHLIIVQVLKCKLRITESPAATAELSQKSTCCLPKDQRESGLFIVNIIYLFRTLRSILLIRKYACLYDQDTLPFVPHLSHSLCVYVPVPFFPLHLLPCSSSQFLLPCYLHSSSICYKTINETANAAILTCYRF